MKIKLAVSSESYEELKGFLTEKGIEIDDDAEFVLTQSGKYVDRIAVRDAKTGEKIHIAVKDIVYAESLGHKVTVHTAEKDWISSDRLYQLCAILDPKHFLRISVSTVISTDKVKRIMPTLSRKFVLTMENGDSVEVTRSYYNIVKEFFGI